MPKGNALLIKIKTYDLILIALHCVFFSKKYNYNYF